MALLGADADDEISYLRTGDQLCLACASQSKSADRSSEQVLLAAQGFGNRICFLEEASNPNIPPDLSLCCYVLQQSLSLRALQEMVTTDMLETIGQANRTLLYGHAILLRHSLSDMYLACLSTSSSRDKLAFDVGLQESLQGEACWWTIHPASKQRSEGEKVRIGDDLILVSVSSERYLHLAPTRGGQQCRVDASFQQTLWMIWPISSSTVQSQALSFVNGLDVLRFSHGHLDEFLTVPPHGCKDDQYISEVNYETGAVAEFARSLWRMELNLKKWNGSYLSWGQPCRIRHLTSGKYLAVKGNKDICIVPRSHKELDDTIFSLQLVKADKAGWDSEEDHGMGSPDIKYGDSVAFIQHVSTGLWLSHMVVENVQLRSGKAAERKAVMHPEGHMDDGFSVTRARGEEAKSAGIIRKSTSLFLHFISALNSLRRANGNSEWDRFSVESVTNYLEDLIDYFAEAEDEVDHEEQQKKAKALRNRQDLFREEGMVKLVLETIDKLCEFKSGRDFAAVAGEDAGDSWEHILNQLYALIAAMIRHNHNNCALFAQAARLDWLITRLESQQASTGVLDVLQCVLVGSPEALNIIKEHHIKSMISQLDKHGRDPKILDVLCSLCVGNGVAVRANQNLICDHLLPSRDLLLQTALVDEVQCMRPNVFICMDEGSAVYKKWYFEVSVDQIENVTGRPVHFRVGFANTHGFRPYRRGGEGWGSSGVGDDLFSFGFDGMNLWAGGVSKPAPWTGNRLLSKGDIVGVCLDMTLPRIIYHVNGNHVKAAFENFNLDGMFYPVISLSAKVSARFILGSQHGRFKYNAPKGFAAISECLMPKDELLIEPCLDLGDLEQGIVYGPSTSTFRNNFVPAPVDTSNVALPGYIEMLRDKLAENIHELWCMNKIEGGWTWGPNREDNKKVHPCLTFFSNLTEEEKNFDITMAYETLRTLIALDYHISIDEEASKATLKRLRLPMNYLMSNGYKPAPYNLSTITINPKMERLVEQLAENAHNVWARDRMGQGWTYGLAEDNSYKRNPQLVPYNQLDDVAKKLNRDTASETIRTILGFGYTLEAPTGEGQEGTFRGLAREIAEHNKRGRVLRAEKTYTVTEGKWYYEFEVRTAGRMRVGWAHPSLGPFNELGTDGKAYVFDGFLARKWHQGSEHFGRTWNVNDVIGCLLNLDEMTINFTLNGEFLSCPSGSEICFRDIEVGDGFVPVVMISAGEEAKLYFGQDVYDLKYFTVCGLQEGYEPFCVNMKKVMPMWYTKSQPSFVTVSEDHLNLEVSRIPAGVEGPPCLRINHKRFGSLENHPCQYLRLSMPVECRDFPTSGELALSLPVPNLSSPHMKKNIWKQQGSLECLDTDSLEMPRKEHKNIENEVHESEPIIEYGPEHTKHNGIVEKDKKKIPLGRKMLMAKTVTAENSNVIAEPTPEPAPTHAKSKRSRFFTLKSSSMDSSSSIKMDEPSPRSGERSGEVNGSLSPSLHKKKMKSRSPDQSPPGTLGRDRPNLNIPSDTSMESGERPKLGTMSTGSSFDVNKSFDILSDASEQDSIEISGTTRYHFSLRIFPGQDPAEIFVGWVTPGFHQYSESFELTKTREVKLNVVGDSSDQESFKRCDCYMICVGDHLDLLQTPGGRRHSSGIVVGCVIDVYSGELTYYINGREINTKYQVEPCSKLFPAAFLRPTGTEMIQFELGRAKNCLPLSAAWFRSDHFNSTPQCPSRVHVQFLQSYDWARMPHRSLKVDVKHVSEGAGWQIASRSPVSWLAIHVPEENRCRDILELVENDHQLSFHAHTLDLYCAVCFQGNHRVARAVSSHVSEDQLMYLIKCEYLAGSLRVGFYRLLIAIYLETHMKNRLMTQREFIIPLDASGKFSDDSQDDYQSSDPKSVHSHTLKRALSNSQTVCIRPELKFGDEGGHHRAHDDKRPPYCNLDILKEHAIESLSQAVHHGVSHCKDPIGGDYNTLFMPLVDLCDRLLVMGVFDDDDLKHLLILIHPATFDETYQKGITDDIGLLQMKLDEPVKLSMCSLLQHLCDNQLRHRIETIAEFADDFVAECQADQVRRFLEVQNTDMPPVIAAKKTKEFRSTPAEQMRMLLAFKKPAEASSCPAREDLREVLGSFHSNLVVHCGISDVNAYGNKEERSWLRRILNSIFNRYGGKGLEDKLQKFSSDSLSKLISETMIAWAEEKHIHNNELVREMFSLLYRQYNGVQELCTALSKTYMVSMDQRTDILNLLTSLGHIRALLKVQMGPMEEEAMIKHLWELTDNKVFYQHPDLMRALCLHETVMNVMVNVLEKHQTSMQLMGEAEESKKSAEQNACQNGSSAKEQKEEFNREVITACSRFLSYFCRVSTRNQMAMFQQIDYFLQQSDIGLSYPSLRGSCPLDVAAASLMDNNELALAMREQHLEKVIQFLSKCGVQDNARMLSLSKPLIGWDPVDGERYLDFMRHAVWVNGETVEENANLVVRLLIRHPECLGPALRGEGKGLLVAMEEAIELAGVTEEFVTPTMIIREEVEERGGLIVVEQPQPEEEEDEDDVDMGGAILTFYSTLIDLLGRCAPDEILLSQGRTEPQRMRAILRSLVPLDDLVAVLSLKFNLPSPNKKYEKKDDGAGKPLGADLKGLTPQHKEFMLLFLERVYGIGEPDFFFSLLEKAFLPDLRAATTMDTPNTHDHDMALALNRYLCNEVLPMLTRHAHIFNNADQHASLLHSTLHTVYRLSSCRSLTRGQRDTVSDFMAALTRSMKPSVMQRLLRKLIVDVPALVEHTYVPLKILQLHFERCITYYGSLGGWGTYGAASDEEKRLTMMLFTGLFDSLAEKDYDSELFEKALPCLTAIGSALPPDYSMAYHDETYVRESSYDGDGAYQPNPVETSRIFLNESLMSFGDRFAEHLHEMWSLEMLESGYSCGTIDSPTLKQHPRLRIYKLLNSKEKDIYREPTRENLKALLAWGWNIERSKTADQHQSQRPRRLSKSNLLDSNGYNPRPMDMSNITLTREMQNMAERLAENAHDVWAKKMKLEMQMQGMHNMEGGGVHPQMVPFDILTDEEKKKYRQTSQALIKYLQVNGYRLQSEEEAEKLRKSMEADGIVRGSSIIEKRFAYNLLEKLLHYVDKALSNMKPVRRDTPGFRKKEEEKAYKFFVKIVLPLTERYFFVHASYFVSDSDSSAGRGGIASNREKELVASLFYKLAHLVRQKVNLFGRDLPRVIHCLRVIAQSTDASVVIKHSSEATKNGLYMFFRYAADDLVNTLQNIKTGGRFTHVKAVNVPKHTFVYGYVPGVLIPILTSLFQHLAAYDQGKDILLDEIQICCYKILSSLYVIGAEKSLYVDKLELQASIERHRPAIGECLAAFAGAFPVAFLEPTLNKHNPNSVLGQLELKNHEDAELTKLSCSIPSLDTIIKEVDHMANSGAKYIDAPHVIEVILPMVCSYAHFWWQHGPDHICRRQGNYWTMVNSVNLNHILSNVLTLIKNNMGVVDAPWMNRIAAIAKPILTDVQQELLNSHCLPVITHLRIRAEKAIEDEENLKKEFPNGGSEMEEAEFIILENYHLIIRDMHAFYPLLIKYVDSHRTNWLKAQNMDAEKLFQEVAAIFNTWTRSANFRREEQNFVAQMEAEKTVTCSARRENPNSDNSNIPALLPMEKRKKNGEGQLSHSLVMTGLKRLLPIGMNLFGAREQELIQQAKQMFQHKDGEKEVREFLSHELHIQEKEKVAAMNRLSLITNQLSPLPSSSSSSSSGNHEARRRSFAAWQAAASRINSRPGPKNWQRLLYNKMATTKLMQVVEMNREKVVEKIISIAQVLQRLYVMEQPAFSKRSAWRRLMSAQRKRAVMACFRMTPLYHLPRHRAINYFLRAYREKWLNVEDSPTHLLIDDLTHTRSDELKEACIATVKDPSFQLILTFSRAACLQQDGMEEDDLYMSYAEIMSNSCSGGDDDDDDDEDDEGSTFQEKEEAKQKLLSEQGRLAERGAAEMVLMSISASKGASSEIIACTLKLGISLLKGGNELVQMKMLTYLQDKMDVGFFTSMSELIESCSVLDLEAFERYNKAEGLGVNSGDNAGERALHDANFTCALFRFLQLLCEGHYLEFQDYLRTQVGSHTTVNIINCTVDYLLRLQESISDFYWHYSGREVVDPAGRENFSRAFKVATQVFRTLTEYIQGPCNGNQLALAHSRLWDAMGGFLHVFAHLQKKLSQDPTQLELLRELMNLQNEMVVMLLSMLEGNVMNGTIGKQMVDMLVESSQNVEMLLKFFDMFLKLKDLQSSEAFREYDTNQDGVISHKEFQAAMEAQKMYTLEEIDYLMKCADSNNDGIIDFTEFSDRFHGPAKDIGFNLAVLLTNLADHMPEEMRLQRFLDLAESMLSHFEPFLGRIEIMGRSKRIEKVYFEIKESNKAQWEKPQIKESKQQFLHELVNEGGEKEKLEDFVNFCEDTIFEMQHAACISDTTEGIIDGIARLLSSSGGKDTWLSSAVRALHPSNIKRTISDAFTNVEVSVKTVRSMSLTGLLFGIIKLFFIINWKLVLLGINIVCKIISFVIGSGVLEETKEFTGSLKKTLTVPTVARRHTSQLSQIAEMGLQNSGRRDTMSAFGIDLTKSSASGGGSAYKLKMKKKRRALSPGSSFELDDDQSESASIITQEESEDSASTAGDTASIQESTTQECLGASGPRRGSTVFPSFFLAQELGASSMATSKTEDLEDEDFERQGVPVSQTFLSMFARNFYNLKYIALALAFLINFILLFFKVSNFTPPEDKSTPPPEYAEGQCFSDNCTLSTEDAGDMEDLVEEVLIEDGAYYLYPILRLVIVSHTLVSISMLIAYCALKVPLAIFKREKEIARNLEFEGMWIVEQPCTDDIKAQWDRLVISTKSFPDNYWDKFVKKKVYKKYIETLGEEKLNRILGLETSEPKEDNESLKGVLMGMVDWKYLIWKCGVICTDRAFLYIAWYLLFSILGHVNNFFYAVHLLDVAMGFKTLRTVLESVTHNGKQLMLTLLMTCVIIYIYTVLAFNFFRKFYVTGEEGETEFKCHSMLSCFVFHLHSGLRAGGGIADEIEPPDGDEYEMYRILFDITFFFFVIVILLAIIQGLIIDSFGELRDQQEQVKEDMETKCFICGIGNEYFNKVPHGFEVHTAKEHDLSNYMFYLMYLINKPETEHTGQESYVWEMYQQRCWDFFPVGDCFRKQYEEE